jgi:hypothetical protein
MSAPPPQLPAYKLIPGTNFVVDAFRHRPAKGTNNKVFFLTHAHAGGPARLAW